MTRLDDLYALIAKPGEECIIWPFCLSDGYGLLRVDGRSRLAHAISCESVNGPRPLGADAAHACGVRQCVNPLHLRWASRAENCADRVTHGTNGRKLSAVAVEAIRVAAKNGESQRSIGRRFGVSQHMVHRVCTNKNWATFAQQAAALAAQSTKQKEAS